MSVHKLVQYYLVLLDNFKRRSLSMSSRARSFKEGGFTYVVPKDGFVYMVEGEHVHTEIIQAIKRGEIPCAYLREKIPAGNHTCRSFIKDVFKEDNK